jgi:hypothetical protein
MEIDTDALARYLVQVKITVDDARLYATPDVP